MVPFSTVVVALGVQAFLRALTHSDGHVGNPPNRDRTRGLAALLDFVPFPFVAPVGSSLLALLFALRPLDVALGMGIVRVLGVGTPPPLARGALLAPTPPVTIAERKRGMGFRSCLLGGHRERRKARHLSPPQVARIMTLVGWMTPMLTPTCTRKKNSLEPVRRWLTPRTLALPVQLIFTYRPELTLAENLLSITARLGTFMIGMTCPFPK